MHCLEDACDRSDKMCTHTPFVGAHAGCPACAKRVKDAEIQSTDGFQEMFSKQAGYGQVSRAEMLMLHVGLEQLR